MDDDNDEVNKAIFELLRQFGNNPEYKKVILDLLGILSEESDKSKLEN